MSTITFHGGPFDGEQRAVKDTMWDSEYGCVVRSDAVGAIKPRYAVYLPNGRGNVMFDSYAATLDEGLARLSKEHRNG